MFLEYLFSGSVLGIGFFFVLSIFLNGKKRLIPLLLLLLMILICVSLGVTFKPAGSKKNIETKDMIALRQVGGQTVSLYELRNKHLVRYQKEGPEGEAISVEYLMGVTRIIEGDPLDRGAAFAVIKKTTIVYGSKLFWLIPINLLEPKVVYQEVFIHVPKDTVIRLYQDPKDEMVFGVKTLFLWQKK